MRSAEVQQLTNYIVEQIRRCVPEPLHEALLISNLSSRKKCDILAKVDGHPILRASSVADRFEIAAVYDDPVVAFIKGEVNPAVGTLIERCLAQRTPSIVRDRELAEPFKGFKDVYVHEDTESNTIRLVLGSLTQKQYERVSKAIVPILPPLTRFDREGPL